MPQLLRYTTLTLLITALHFCVGYSTCLANNESTSTSSADTVIQKNAHLGELFLHWNAKQPGVVSLPNGLQYKILKQGSGRHPALNDRVTVDYQGQFINGHVFDSSYQRGQPVTFPVNGVILGWQEALQRMRTGSEWLLYIPAKLAYGEKGVPGKICGNQTLLFRVHLLSISP